MINFMLNIAVRQNSPSSKASLKLSNSYELSLLHTTEFMKTVLRLSTKIAGKFLEKTF